MAEHEFQTWEYQTAANPDEDRLNALGADGWELVGVENGICYFKRLRPSFREQVTLDQKRRYYALWNVTAGEEEAR